MEWFSNWWAGLELAEQVLYCIALPSSLLLILKAFLIVVGVGAEAVDTDFGGTDFDPDGFEVPSEFGAASLFTLQGVASFLCVFGWGTIFMTRAGVPFIFAAPIAFTLGAGVMFLIAKIMVSLTKLAQTGTLDVKNLLGSMGTVYLRIPPKGEGTGKVMVQTSERLVEFDAVSECETVIANNAQIRVIDILGENILVVEPS